VPCPAAAWLGEPEQRPIPPRAAAKNLPVQPATKIADGALYFEDRTRTPAYEQQLRPINLELSNFSTKKNNENGYSLDAMSTEGEQLAWKGSFTMSPLRSNGSFAISHLKATSVGDLAGPYLPFTLPRGMAEFSARYALDGSANPARLDLRPGLEPDRSRWPRRAPRCRWSDHVAAQRRKRRRVTPVGSLGSVGVVRRGAAPLHAARWPHQLRGVTVPTVDTTQT
jgi:hypothetical protein